MPRFDLTLLAALVVVGITGCGDGDFVSPEQPPGITGVTVTASAYLVTVGSTTQLTAVVDADPGVEYTVDWSLPAGTTAATIDASTGVLTGLARGFVSPMACATASPLRGHRQTVCGDTDVGVGPEVASGSRLAFVREGTVWVSQLDGAAPVPLVPDAVRPAWSPEGARIAFARPADDRLDKWQLCVAWHDGSDARCVTGERDGNVVGGPSWSPDGVRVAFSVFTYSCPNCGQYGGYFSGLLVLNTLRMEVDTVDTPTLRSVSWSPDGRKIAFTTYGSGEGTFGRGALGIMSPDGSERVILAGSFGSYSVLGVAWSPDGGRLALGLNDEDACPWYCDTAIGIVNADGTDLKVLAKARTDEQSYALTPTWSPDGTRIAYTLSRGDQCWYEYYPCGSDIMAIGADGGSEIRLASGGFPSWRR